MLALRPYQAAAVQAARQAIANGARSVLIVAPTGAGKTAIGATIAAAAVSRGTSVHWLTHRHELVAQAPAGISISTVQSGAAPPADMLIVDEAHHYVARQWRQVASPYKYRIGLTATPNRADGVGLGSMFDTLIPVCQPRELIDSGVLVPAHVYAPPKRQGQSLAGDPLDYVRGKTVIFCATIDHARELAERGNGACIDESTKNRTEIFQRFLSGEISYLTNVYVLTEGWDCPTLETIVLARGCGAYSTYIQICGRAMRAHPGKTHCTIYDLIGSARDHGLPSDDRVYSLDGQGVSSAQHISVVICPACYATYRGASCPRCGRIPPPPAPPPITVRELQPVFQREADSSKLAYLQKLKNEAREKGYKPGWVFWKYKAKYGEYPPTTY